MIRISETQRTVILVLLLLFAVAFIYYVQNGIDDNFINQL